MKTHTIQYNTSVRQSYHPMKKEKGHSAELYENNNRGYSVAFSGSGASKIEEAAAKRLHEPLKNFGKTWYDKMFRSNTFHKLLEIFEEKTVVANSLVALVVAGGLRPATNMAMAGKNDREDSMYAASHAIASAVIGFIVSSIVMAPLDKAFKKVKADPEKYLGAKEVVKNGKTIVKESLAPLLGVKKIGPRQLEKSNAYKLISKGAQMIPDTFVLGIPKALMTIALIPPILKYVFGLEKHKKTDNAQQNVITYATPNVSFAKFIGGEK